MGEQLAAVVGVGQTHHRSSRKDVSMAGLVREAAVEALEDAGMTWKDIDAVVIGKAPDMFEGVAMPDKGEKDRHQIDRAEQSDSEAETQRAADRKRRILQGR